jgi:hypothetical protein
VAICVSTTDGSKRPTTTTEETEIKRCARDGAITEAGSRSALQDGEADTRDLTRTLAGPREADPLADQFRRQTSLHGFSPGCSVRGSVLKKEIRNDIEPWARFPLELGLDGPKQPETRLAVIARERDDETDLPMT